MKGARMTISRALVIAAAVTLICKTVIEAQGPTLVPSVTPYGIVNSATFRSSFSPVAAPGALLTIFGANLSNTSVSSSTPPFPTQLPGSQTRVLFGGTAAALFSVAPTQINLQVPFGLSGAFVDVVVQNEN